jgi:hypothetical protein
VKIDAPFNGVTVLTHGFQLSFGEDYPAWMFALARQIADAAGGGNILTYDKGKAEFVGTPQRGKHLVLLSNWVKESDISDSGFSEAAADALFAAIAKLNVGTGGDLFDPRTPLHFIGHSRGTVVNSEIIQRLGVHFPEVENVHMTTLDPHDFEQKSLDVPIEEIREAIEKASTILSVVPVVGPVAKVVGQAAAQLKKLLELAETFGLNLSKIEYSDFKDPDVFVWENVRFADNYYQDAAHPENFTATPNGRSIPGVDYEVYLGGRQDGQTDRVGFTQDDFDLLGSIGWGGPHSRVWRWYSGTTDLNIPDFPANDEPIFRSGADARQAFELQDVLAQLGFYFPFRGTSTKPRRRGICQSGRSRTPPRRGRA